MRNYCTVKEERKNKGGGVLAGGRQSREQKPERVESVKEWYKTNKALFSMRGACVAQMEVIPFAIVQRRVHARLYTQCMGIGPGTGAGYNQAVRCKKAWRRLPA